MPALKTWIARLVWMAAGVVGLYALTALASVAQGGSLDPPGPPNSSTMHTLADIAPSWHLRLLSTEGGDQFGCGSQRFECVLGGPAVLDRETGLVWQRQPALNFSNWANATLSCANASVNDRVGWRLPTLAEMRTLMNPTQSNPALPANHPFQGTDFEILWTSTQSSTSPGEAHTVSLATGAVGSRARGEQFGPTFMCVRGPGGDTDSGAASIEPAPPPWSQTLSADSSEACNSPRFQCVLNNEAVLDRETGLVWQRAPETDDWSWDVGIHRCVNRTIGGRLGWRLGSKEELLSLLDASPDHLPDGHPFIGLSAPSDLFWTSSTNWEPGHGDDAYYVDISTGGAFTQLKSVSGFARPWCVRGGAAYDGGQVSPSP